MHIVNYSNWSLHARPSLLRPRVKCICNQSINQTSISPISPAKPGSAAPQPNQCSTVKSRKQFRNINMPLGMQVSIGERPSQRDVFRCFLKVATEVAERTDSGRLFQRDGAQEWQALAPVLVLTLGDWQTIIIVWSQWTGWQWWGKHGVKINRLFFMQGFVGQQTDLKQYSKRYWQPVKGTKQWKTASKWRRLCHQAGQSILHTLKPCEVNVSDTIQKWIAIIETTGHKSSSN